MKHLVQGLRILAVGTMALGLGACSSDTSSSLSDAGARAGAGGSSMDDDASSLGGGGGAAGSAQGGATGGGTGGDPSVDAGTQDTGGNDDIGTSIGSMWVTYYIVTMESDHTGPKDATLYSADCKPLANVTTGFFNDLCIQGSGKLDDGRVLGYAGDCACAAPCAAFDGYRKCWGPLDSGYPWGMGSTGNAIVPLRSWAVDNSVIPPGTVLYAKQWDGVSIPAHDGLGGFVHDGCFRADDTGGPVQGNHFDFAAGSRSMWHALEAIHPTNSSFDVFMNPGKCAYLRK